MTASANSVGARFSVVIANYNGGAMLEECVCSVVREGVPAARIIIVDNGSQDGSIDNLQRNVDGLSIIHNSCNAGFAKAVNQGINLAVSAASPSEFLLLLNNDAQLEPGALQAFAAGFGTLPNLAIAGGQLRYPGGRLQSAFAPFPSVAEEILPRFERHLPRSLPQKNYPAESDRSRVRPRRMPLRSQFHLARARIAGRRLLLFL